MIRFLFERFMNPEICVRIRLITNLMQSFMIMMTNHFLLQYGTDKIAAMGMSIFAPVIIKVFMNDADIITNGAIILRCQQAGMVFMAVTLVSTCVCQAFGNAVGAFVLSISRQGIIYVVALFALSKAFGYLGVLTSQACADVVTAIIAVTIIWKLMKDFDK